MAARQKRSSFSSLSSRTTEIALDLTNATNLSSGKETHLFILSVPAVLQNQDPVARIACCDKLTSVVSRNASIWTNAELRACVPNIVTTLSLCIATSASLAEKRAVMRALGAVVFDNGHTCGTIVRQVIAQLCAICDNAESVDIRRIATACLGNLCFKSRDAIVHPFLEPITLAILSVFESALRLDVADDIISLAKLCYASLRSLQMLLDEAADIPGHHVTRIVSDCIRCLSTYSQHTSTNSLDTLSLHSDSELSDAESSTKPSLNVYSVRILQSCLQCIQSVCRTAGKLIHTYWFLLFPEDSAGPIISLVSSHSSIRVRTSTALTIAVILANARSLLLVAEIRKSTFLSLSQRLGDVVVNLHTTLTLLVSATSDASLLQALCKALKELVSNCVYPKLPSHLLGMVANVIIPIVDSHNTYENLCVVCASMEVMAVILHASINSEKKKGFESTTLLDDRALSLTIDALILWVQSKHASLLQASAWSCLEAAARCNFLHNSKSDTLLSHACALLQDNTVDATVHASIVKFLHGLMVNESCSIKDFERIVLLLKSQNEAVRLAISDTLGAWSNRVCSHVSTSVYAYLTGMVFMLLSDASSPVRSTAWHHITHVVSLQRFISDAAFVEALTDMFIPALTDRTETFAVKLKAASAFGGMCDIIYNTINQTQNDDLMVSLHRHDYRLFNKLSTMAFTLAVDNEKVRCHGIRALGSVIGFFPEQSGNISQLEKFVECVAATALAGSPKTRWNAAAAASRIFNNDLGIRLIPVRTAQLRDTLLSLLSPECKNYKIRIHACGALACATQRSCILQPHEPLHLLLLPIVAALDLSKQAEGNYEFVEQQYRQSLIYHLSIAVCRVLSFLTVTDQGTLTWLKNDGESHSVSEYFKECLSPPTIRKKRTAGEEDDEASLVVRITPNEVLATLQQIVLLLELKDEHKLSVLLRSVKASIDPVNL